MGDEAVRTARHTLLPELGEAGQRRLAAARVLVMGAGGLGAPVLQYLAAAGVGTIAVVDDDVVEMSNLQRQVIHGHADLGTAKTSSAARRLRDLAPASRIIEVRERLTPANAATILAGWDVVVDGTDTFATRYLVSDTCADLGIPLVWGSVLRFDAQVSVFWSRPPAPNVPVTLRDLFPQPPDPGSVPSCAEAGVLGALCGIAGSLMAVETIKLIAGIGEVLIGRVAVIDALAARIHEVPFAASEPASPEAAAPPPAAANPVPALAGAEMLLDVREPAEFGVDPLPGAVNVPVGEIEQAAQAGGEHVAVLLRTAGVPDGAACVTYCAAGIRAARAARALREVGYPVQALTPQDVAALRAAEVAS